MYTYFIYFTFIKDGIRGDGNTNWIMDKLINNINLIREIEKIIKDNHSLDSINISNFILLK